MSDDRPGPAEEAVRAARATSAAVEAERDRLDAALDRGEASFADLAEANARVRLARAALQAAELALDAQAPEQRR